MRMRKKPNLDKRMQLCQDLMEPKPENRRGLWREAGEPLFVELGCGKGSFTVKSALAHPEVQFVALERVADALLLAMEKAKAEGLNNVWFLNKDVSAVNDYFADGEIDRIIINFCDPWPKSRDAKLRLTAPGFLRQYASALAMGGKLYFRTDNLPLFEWSTEQLKNEGWMVTELTNDAHNEIRTDYEDKFIRQGIPIHMLTAVKGPETKTRADGEVPRLRNAALSDARGYVCDSSAGM